MALDLAEIASCTGTGSSPKCLAFTYTPSMGPRKILWVDEASRNATVHGSANLLVQNRACGVCDCSRNGTATLLPGPPEHYPLASRQITACRRMTAIKIFPAESLTRKLNDASPFSFAIKSDTRFRRHLVSPNLPFLVGSDVNRHKVTCNDFHDGNYQTSTSSYFT